MRAKTSRWARPTMVGVGVVAMTVAGGVVAQAASYTLSGRIPRYGAETFDANDFYTTTQYKDINFQYSTNPYSSSVKPVRCSNFTDISSYKVFAANYHTSRVIAAGVVDGTCYNITIESDTTNYWDFVATVRS